MGCFDDYITASTDTPSKSGSYFVDLPGCTVSLLTDLVKEDQSDSDACFDYLYKTAQRNLKIDVQRKLAGKFHVDKKLLTRETSEFLTTYNNAGLAGVSISFYLPKYARIQIVSVDCFAQNVSPEPHLTIYFYKDDANGELLTSVTEQLAAGRNRFVQTIEFDSEDLSQFPKLFVAYSTTQASLRNTQNRYYPTDSIASNKACLFDCWSDVDGVINQVNGGGLNVKFIIYCSIEKFICDNLPLFTDALFYKLGIETMKERITTQLVNQTTVLTEDRAKELLGIFTEDYNQALSASIESIRIQEDPICFLCKRSVSSKTSLP